MCGQHFLGTELRYYQPIPYLAHMAAVAPGMRVATGIILLSMLNPVQVAEDFATLDVVTGGRATFGTAVGYSPREFQAFGVERSERGTTLRGGAGADQEALERRRGRARRHLFPARGDGSPLGAPVPEASPADLDRRAIGARREACGPARGRVVRATLPDPRCAPRLVELFGEERESAGLPPATELPVRRELLIADSKEEARRGAAFRSEARYRTYLSWGLAQGGDLDQAGGGFAEADEAEAEGRFLLGPAEEVARVALTSPRRHRHDALHLQAAVAGPATRRGDETARALRNAGASPARIGDDGLSAIPGRGTSRMEQAWRSSWTPTCRHSGARQ